MTHFFGISEYGAFVTAFILLLIIPGPGNLAIMTSTAKGGVLGGIMATLGVIAGDQVLLWITVAGVASILKAYAGALVLIQWVGAAYLVWLGSKMILAKPGDKPILNIKPGQYFRQALVITLFNPKAVVFYLAFFPLFINPQTHLGFITFSVMAATVAILAFIYCFIVVIITHFLAEKIRSNQKVSSFLQKIAGLFLVGFGLKLAFSKI
jgi:leucine efflux protein